MIDSSKYPFKYIHKHENGCGDVAFYFVGPPKHNTTIPAEEAVFPDGSHPSHGEPFKCGACGGIFQEIILECVEDNKP